MSQKEKGIVCFACGSQMEKYADNDAFFKCDDSSHGVVLVSSKFEKKSKIVTQPKEPKKAVASEEN